MKVLVTGGAGFLGSHIVEEFAKEGHEVLVLDNLENGKESHLQGVLGPKVVFKKCDILDPQIETHFKDVKVVIHLASFSSVLSSIENPEKTFKVNVIGAEKVLMSCLKAGVSVFVNANSAEAMYGKNLSFPLDEKSSLDPQSPFAGSKAAFECYLSGLVKGLKSQAKISSNPKSDKFFTWVSLRLPNIYGSRMSKFNEAPFIGYCLDSLKRGLTPSLPQNGQRSRDYVSAQDVSRAFLMAAHKGLEANLDDFFNIGSGQEIRDIEIFELLKHAIQKQSLEFDDASAFAKALKVGEPKFGETPDHESPRSLLNSTRSEAFFGWKSTQKIHDSISDLVGQFFSSKS